MIIDTHTHLGFDVVFDYNVTENDLILGMEMYGVDISIVQPSIPRPYLEDHREYHDRIYQLCKAHPGRFYGMASINTHFRRNDYYDELKRCVYELGFVGAKITPIGHAAHPATLDSMHVYEMCAKLDIPVMIHTGEGMPFADPIACLPGIKAFPQIKFILAHAGSNLLFEQAFFIAKEYPNVYLEPSWLNVLNTRTIIDTLGAGRVMFSSDVPENIPVEIAKYKVAARTAENYEKALCGTAREVFKI
jgi:predicted TIM-barrel fold metal-dependent hydrolase